MLNIKDYFCDCLAWLFMAFAVVMLVYSCMTAPARIQEYNDAEYLRICEQYPEAHCGQ